MLRSLLIDGGMADIWRYCILPLLDLGERICVKMVLFGLPLPSVITTNEAKVICAHDRWFVRPFLRCFLSLEEEYVGALDRKWRRPRSKTPRLENLLTMFAAYSNNNGLINPKNRRQMLFGMVERTHDVHPLVIQYIANNSNKYGHSFVDVLFKGRNVVYINKILSSTLLFRKIEKQHILAILRKHQSVKLVLSHGYVKLYDVLIENYVWGLGSKISHW